MLYCRELEVYCVIGANGLNYIEIVLDGLKHLLTVMALVFLAPVRAEGPI